MSISDLSPLTARELVLLHQLMNSDDPFEREFAWFLYMRKCEAQRKK